MVGSTLVGGWSLSLLILKGFVMTEYDGGLGYHSVIFYGDAI